MSEEKKRNPKKIEWDDYPKDIFGWVLWVFPQKLWKIIIVVVAIAIIYGFYQLIAEKNLIIEDKARNRILKEKLRYWNGSNDPALKSGLLKLWNERGDVPEEIWQQFNEYEDKEVLIAMASHPWVPKDIEERLLGNDNIKIRVASIFNRRKKNDAIQLLATDRSINVRITVAVNSNTPGEILNKLAADEDGEVRSGVA